MPTADHRSLRHVPKTVGVLGLLALALPFNLALTATALVRFAGTAKEIAVVM